MEDNNGFYGQFGGQFVPEILKPSFDKIAAAFEVFLQNSQYQEELKSLLKSFAGRETPMYFCENLSKKAGGAKIYAKREDLLHGGAHKTNNVLGQMIIARILGVKEVICETGAGQHGVAVSMVAAKFGLSAKIFMGAKDVARQKTNVDRMKIFGAQVIPVENGSQSLKDAINEAMRYWIQNPHIYYVFGTASGPHPFPKMVAYFQKIIGIEARRQILEIEGKLPKEVIACVGGGSNAIGIFQAFIDDFDVKLIGVEPGGDGEKHGMSLSKGKMGVLHGSLQNLLCDENGNICESHSISAGLDYPGVSPIHSYLYSINRAEYAGVLDKNAVYAYHEFSKTEGIIPALESSHAVYYAMISAKKYTENDVIMFNLSGRGDKDIQTILDYENEKM